MKTGNLRPKASFNVVSVETQCHGPEKPLQPDVEQPFLSTAGRLTTSDTEIELTTEDEVRN